MKTFLEATKTLNPDEKAAKLEVDEGLSSAHEESAQTGQTAAPDRDEKVDLHFVAMVEKDGLLYELGMYFEFWKITFVLIVTECLLWPIDGRKSRPIPHGPTTRDTFLEVI